MDTFSAFDVEWVTLKEIEPYYQNPRKHSQENINNIASSIENFGWQQPIVVDSKNVIIIGHGRYAAAKSLGLDVVPIKVSKELTEIQAKKLRIADNQCQLTSEWDDSLLFKELEELVKVGEGIEDTLISDDIYQDLAFDMSEVADVEQDNSNQLEDTPEGGTRSMSDSGGSLAPNKQLEQLGGNPVIQYNVVFTNESQQRRWYEYLKILKEKYPDEETIADRIDKEIIGVLEESDNQDG